MINVATRFVINGCKDINRVLMINTRFNDDEPTMSLKDQVNGYEENLIRAKLAKYNGNVSQVLNELKLERRTFNQKLSRFHISTSDYKK